MNLIEDEGSYSSLQPKGSGSFNNGQMEVVSNKYILFFFSCRKNVVLTGCFEFIIW